jgi:membrane fusion protein (multidrug efflux system)
MSKGVFWTAVGIAVLAAAGGYHYISQQDTGPAPGANAAPSGERRAVVVEAEPVTVDTVTEDIRAVGTLQANEAVFISSEIAGRIRAFGFGEGDSVNAGAVLVELDADILRAELAKVESDLTLAEANLQRANTLARQGTGTLRARDEAVAAQQAATANLALARARLDKATITAPFAGVVGLRSVSAGAYIIPGDRLVQLSDIDPVKVEFRVPELLLSSLRAGQSIRVTVDALPDRQFDGEIYVIDPLVDANGRAVRLRARIANPDRVLFPGLFARVQIVVERRDNSVLVPESAVFARGDKHFVYRVEADRAVLTEVVLGLRRTGQAEIRRGLGLQDMIITAGHQQVRNGGLVELAATGTGS